MDAYLTRYKENAVPKLQEAFSYASPYQIPAITKATINVGIGDIVTNNQAQKDVVDLLTRISGQKPVPTKARLSVAGFKIRQGMVVGYKVTLRGKRLRDFLTKLSDFVLPRTRDFHGLKESAATKDGTLNIGIKDTGIFLESPHDLSSQSLQVVISSTARSVDEAKLLYTSTGFIFDTSS
jgi:large subunit ribosomal protein L5